MKIPNLLEIIEALCYGAAQGYHAGNTFAKIEQREVVEQYRVSHQELCEKMRSEADELVGKNVESFRYSYYRQFDTTGARNDYQGQYFGHREHLKTLVMAWYVFEDNSYLEAIHDHIWAICDEYTWCLPAHLGGESLDILPAETGAMEKDGRIVPYTYSHEHRLDLFACETAKDLAEQMRILGTALYSDVRHRVISLIIDRVMNQYLTFNRIHGFEIDRSNWSAVCGASIGVAALYLIDDERLLAPVIQRVISDLDVFIGSYGEDGIGREGIGYWRYGFSNLCYFADILKERTGGKLDLFADEKVKKVAFFPGNAYLYRDYCVCFSDGRPQYSAQKELFCYLKSVYPDMPDVTALYDGVPGQNDDVVDLRKILWGGKTMAAQDFRERRDYYPDAQWFVSCTDGPKGKVSFVIRGGHNDEPHNHNDLGNFVLMVEDEQLISETGGGLYTKDYFSAGRYQYLVTSSRGHSLPIINGQEQKAGRQYQAQVLSVETEGDIDRICIELKGAYDVAELASYIREAEFDRKIQKLTIRDHFKGSDLEVQERFVSLFPEFTGKRHKVVIEGMGEPEKLTETYLTSKGEEGHLYIQQYHYKTDNEAIEFNFYIREV